MFNDLLKRASDLKGQGEPFVLATVVACRPPTSAKPGAKAIVQADGCFTGWVGGSCAQPLVTQEALKALNDGNPRLIVLAPDPQEVFPLEGVVTLTMTCQSEGTLAVYLEPFLPKPQLLVIGQSPMARSLVTLGKNMDFSVCACDPAATEELFPDADTLEKDLETLKERVAGPRSFVVVATMGHYDEEALGAVVGSEARYVGLVASPKRGKAVIKYLGDKGFDQEALKRVKYPAGLDIGAHTPEEIALSILAEIVQESSGEPAEPMPAKGESPQSSHAGGEEVATDPICGMTVSVAEARYVSTNNGTAFYFCCLPCKDTFDREPERSSAPRTD